jgi:hypothetical protein
MNFGNEPGEYWPEVIVPELDLLRTRAASEKAFSFLGYIYPGSMRTSIR